MCVAERLARIDLEKDQLVSLHGRLANQGCHAAGKIGGEQVVEVPADK